VIFLLALAFTGVFIGLTSFNSGGEVSLTFSSDHRKSFFSILALIVIVVFFVITSFKYLERFVSVSYFGKATSTKTESVTENYIGKALNLYSNDLYLRTYSQVYLTKLNSIVAEGTALSDAEKADLQTSFDQSLKSAEMAVVYNPSNYLNSQMLGFVYQTVGALGLKDAYSKAIVAYQNASNLNPLNPGIKLSMANASFADGKISEAKDYANQALALKPDYADALVALSQIAKNEGDNAQALSYAQTALSITPNDKNLIQYINSLNNPAPAPTPVPTPNKTKK
jgi:tetratricopeptide (TPR) repeat protein